MCFDPVTAAIAVAAVTAVTSMVSDKMAMDTQNKAAADSYNQAARQAERVNRAAIAQQAETDSRNRVQTMRAAENNADKARAAILENRRAMATARASAGTSGLMGLPLNMIEQNYQALIGGVGTNLTSTNQQLDENYFFDSMDSMLRAQSISNQAIPQKPTLQKFGWGNVLSGALKGASAGLGSMGGGAGGTRPQPYTPVPFNPNAYNNVQTYGNSTVYSNL